MCIRDRFRRWRDEELETGKQIVPVMVNRKRRYHTSSVTSFDTRPRIAVVTREQLQTKYLPDLNKSGSRSASLVSSEPGIDVADAPPLVPEDIPPRKAELPQVRDSEESGLASVSPAVAVAKPSQNSTLYPPSQKQIPKSTQAETMRALAKLREQHGFRLASEVIYRSVADGPELQLDRGGALAPELVDVPRSAIPEPPMFRKDAAVALACIASILRGEVAA